MKRALALALVLGGSPLAAQHPGIAGAWKVTYVAGTRIEGGEVTTITATGVLTIEQRRDSLIGTLVMDPQADLPARPPAAMAGLFRDGAAVLIATSSGTVTINEEERPITVVSTWTLHAEGDALSGTVERRIEGIPIAPSGGPTPVSGRRVAP